MKDQKVSSISDKPPTASAAKSGGSYTSLGANQKDPILKMAERPDWTLFRSIEGLCQKAGVSDRWLRRLVMKEVADNGPRRGRRPALRIGRRR